jgi:hypothetical protein
VSDIIKPFGIKQSLDMKLYRVAKCVVAMPGIGNTDAWAVQRVYALTESPTVAMFVIREHADQYCHWLIQQQIEINRV